MILPHAKSSNLLCLFTKSRLPLAISSKTIVYQLDQFGDSPTNLPHVITICTKLGLFEWLSGPIVPLGNGNLSSPKYIIRNIISEYFVNQIFNYDQEYAIYVKLVCT